MSAKKPTPTRAKKGMSANRKHVFVSYARINSKAVESLIARISAWGYQIWLDQFDIEAGGKWKDSILNAILNADCLLLMISKAATRSKVVEWELQIAESNGIRVIPVILQRTTFKKPIQRKLDQLQKIFIVDNPYGGAAKLIETLGGLNGPIPSLSGDKKYPAIRRNAMFIGEAIRFLQIVSLSGGHVIFKGGTDWVYFIQLSTFQVDSNIYGEVVGNSNLKRQHKLKDEKIENLYKIGWESPTKDSYGNFQRNWSAKTDRDRALIASEIMLTFINVLDHPLGEDLETEIHLSS